ncbi:MAG: hypothetical protein R2799_12075 [Crocinitomicaceae bacterium]
MKKLLLAWFFVVHSLIPFGCDICSIYFEMTPNDFRSKVGLFYSHRYLNGYPSTGKKHGGLANAWKDKLVKENYGTFELRGEYFPTRWFSIYASVPVVHNTRTIDGQKYADIWGFGDPILMPKFRVLNTRNEGKTNHRITLAAGVKFPVGSVTKQYMGLEQDLDMQPGTGSWDALFSATYLFVVKEFGMNSSVSYKLNTQNKYGYGYGDNVFSQLDFMYLYKKEDFRFFPKIGLYFEHGFQDEFLQNKILDSGGSVLFCSIGFDAYWKGLQFTVLIQPRIAESYGGLEIPAKARLQVGVTYNFKTSKKDKNEKAIK